MIHRFAPAFLALVPVAAHAQATTSIPARTCSVIDAGAEGSRIWSQLTRPDTAAFQRAIDRCAAAGGGTVEVPRGEWLTGPLVLKSNIRFHLARGAELAAATDPALYPDGSRSAILMVRDATNVEITGEGVVDGQGAVWWEKMRDLWRTDPRFASDGDARQSFKDPRPRLLIVQNSRNVRIAGIKLENSPSFHLVLLNADNITIEGVAIEAPAHAPNTDAIDPTDSRHVLIQRNTISVGDDAVAVKSSHVDPAHPDAVSSDIAVIGNTILNGRGICIGSGSKGGVTRMRVENNVFRGSMYGFRIKTGRGKGGEVRDIVFRHNRMTDVAVPLVFTSYYDYRPMDRRVAEKQLAPTGFVLGNQIWPSEDDPARPFRHDDTPHMTGVVVDDLVATGADQVGIAVGLPESPIERLILRNVHVEAHTGFLVRHATVVRQQTSFDVTSGTPVTLQAGGQVTAEMRALSGARSGAHARR